MGNSNQFTKNVFIVSLGPIIAAVISLLAEPIISRLWPPFDFGMISYFNALVASVSPIIFLRYNFAIVQAGDKEERHSLLVLSLMVMVLFIILAYSIFPMISHLFKSDFPFAKYRLLLFTTIVFAGQYTLFRFWSTSEKRFSSIALSVIILQSSNTILMLLFGYLGKATYDYGIIARSLSYILCPLVMLVIYLRKDFPTTLKIVSWKSILKVMTKYKKYPLLDLWGIWASTLSYHIPTVFIAKYWGQEITGLFSKAFGILYMIVLFLGDAVNRVFHKEIADMVNSKRDISEFLKKVVATLSQLSLLPFILLMLIGPEIFSFVLGEVWVEAGKFAGAISLWMYSILISTAVIPLYGVLNRQGQMTTFSITNAVLKVGMLVFLGGIGMSGLTAVSIFSVISTIMMIIQFSIIIRIAGVSLISLLKVIVKPILQLVPLIVVVFSLKHFTVLLGNRLVIVTGILSLPYAYWFYYKQKNIQSIIKHGIAIVKSRLPRR